MSLVQDVCVQGVRKWRKSKCVGSTRRNSNWKSFVRLGQGGEVGGGQGIGYPNARDGLNKSRSGVLPAGYGSAETTGFQLRLFRAIFQGALAQFCPIQGRFPRFRTHLSLRRHQWVPSHPRVRQRKQRLELQRFFLQLFVAHFHKPELALDDAKRVLDLGPDARLELFNLVDDRVDGIVLLVQLF